jgi:hypothetical protein
MLTRFQRMMLRGWATNREIAERFPLIRRSGGFSFTRADIARLRAIVADRPPTALWVWFLLTSVMFMGVAVPLIGLVLTQLPKRIPLLGLPAVVLIALIIAPLALALASGITDVMFRAPPFVEADGDAALYGKFRRQLLMIGGGAILFALVLAWWG